MLSNADKVCTAGTALGKLRAIGKNSEKRRKRQDYIFFYNGIAREGIPVKERTDPGRQKIDE